MGAFDQAARFAAQADPEAVVRRVLFACGVELHFREWLDTRTIPLPGGPDRVADLVAALDGPTAAETALLILEFQSRHDPDKLDVTLEEAAILRGHVRHGPNREYKYRVLTALVYLVGTCPETVLDMTLPGGYGTRHAPLVWNVSADDATAALEAAAAGSVPWGTLFWVPLMAGGGTASAIARWREIVTQTIASPRMRGNLGAIAMEFAELAGRQPEWSRELEGFDMTESQVVNEWIAKGETKGELTAQRRDLLKILNTRFPGTVSAEVTELIRTQDSSRLLQDWFDAALRATSFEQFIDALK